MTPIIDLDAGSRCRSPRERRLVERWHAVWRFLVSCFEAVGSSLSGHLPVRRDGRKR